MTSLSQSPRDRILWILTEKGGKMEWSKIEGIHRDEIFIPEPILDELAEKAVSRSPPLKMWAL